MRSIMISMCVLFTAVSAQAVTIDFEGFPR